MLPVIGGETPWAPLIWSLDESVPVDGKKRTRLHWAALAGDVTAVRLEVLRIGGSLQEHIETNLDFWGLTALDIAKGLGHDPIIELLSPQAPSLAALSLAKLRRSLQDIADRGDTLAQDVAHILASSLQLHEYGLLCALSKAAQGSVSGSQLRRSMSCLECWFADLFNKGCEASLPCEMYLIPCWEQLESFQLRPVQDDDGVVVCPAPEATESPGVAETSMFCRRFASRTGQLFDDVAWSNMVVIGGMVLGCLTCDDANFRKSFSETDVDVYFVGVSGQVYCDHVASLIASLSKKVPNTCSVVRTAQSITLLPGIELQGQKLPNVQIILTPYRSVAHLLFTTDLDCTAMGFDGSRLLATPRAREALVTRRNIVRPEKYMVRGEWRTEARYLKYAARGFRAVDLGLSPTAKALANDEDLLAQLQITTSELDVANEDVHKHLEVLASVRAERAEMRDQAAQLDRKLSVAAGLLVGDWVTSDGLKIRLRRSSSDHDNQKLEGLIANMPPSKQWCDGKCVEVPNEGAVHAAVVWPVGEVSLKDGLFSLQVAQRYPHLQLAIEIFVDKDRFVEQIQREGETEDLGQYDALRSARPDFDMEQAFQTMAERADDSVAAPVDELWWKAGLQGGCSWTRTSNGKMTRSRSPPPVRWARAPERFPDELFEPLPSTRWVPYNPYAHDEDDAIVTDEIGCTEMRFSLERLHSRQRAVQTLAQKVVGTLGIYGARLLLLAKEVPTLAALLVWEVPQLHAGLDRDEVADLLDFAYSAESDGKDDEVEYDGSYGRERSKLVLVNPLPGQDRRGRAGFRCKEMDFQSAIQEKDLESDRFETRGWYDGLSAEVLQDEFATLDPAVWRGIGDFRTAA